MRKMRILCLIIGVLFATALPVQAEENPQQNMQGDVYARYVGESRPQDSLIVDGAADVVTSDGYRISVSGAPSQAFILKAYSIPSSETEAWGWASGCLNNKTKMLCMMDIYFEDAAGNRINANDVKITVSSPTGTQVYSLTTAGHTTKLHSAETSVGMQFTANGSHYYILVLRKSAPEKPDQEYTPDTSNPPTGDNQYLDMNLLTMFISGAMLLWLIKRKVPGLDVRSLEGFQQW